MPSEPLSAIVIRTGLQRGSGNRILEENIGDLKGPDLAAAFQEASKMH
jgi:hypothetical protein